MHFYHTIFHADRVDNMYTRWLSKALEQLSRTPGICQLFPYLGRQQWETPQTTASQLFRKAKIWPFFVQKGVTVDREVSTRQKAEFTKSQAFILHTHARVQIFRWSDSISAWKNCWLEPPPYWLFFLKPRWNHNLKTENPEVKPKR